MSITRVHFNAPQSFYEENRAKKGELKKRAIRLLQAHLHDEAACVAEVGDPQLADACFRILMTDGQWRMHKEKNHA